jgi:hypothetical protein
VKFHQRVTLKFSAAGGSKVAGKDPPGDVSTPFYVIRDIGTSSPLQRMISMRYGHPSTNTFHFRRWPTISKNDVNVT